MKDNYFKQLTFQILSFDMVDSEKQRLLKTNYKLLKKLCHPHDHDQRTKIVNFYKKYRKKLNKKPIIIENNPKDDRFPLSTEVRDKY